MSLSRVVIPGARFGVSQPHPNGAVDESFGTSGKIITDFGSDTGWEYVQAIDFDSINNILAVGPLGILTRCNR